MEDGVTRTMRFRTARIAQIEAAAHTMSTIEVCEGPAVYPPGYEGEPLADHQYELAADTVYSRRRADKLARKMLSREIERAPLTKWTVTPEDLV